MNYFFKILYSTSNTTGVKGITNINKLVKCCKEVLRNRINILLIDKKIVNKRNRNLDSYYVNVNTFPLSNNFSETPHYIILLNTSTDDIEPILSKTRERSTSINPIPDFTIVFPSPDGQSSNIDTIYVKIKLQSFKAIFYKTFVKILVKYLTPILPTS